MIDDSLWTILGLSAVGIVPLAILFLFFKPRPYQPPQRQQPLGHGRGASGTAGKRLSGASRAASLADSRETREGIQPRRDIRAVDGRGMRNLFVLQLYYVFAALGVVVLILAAVLIAAFT